MSLAPGADAVRLSLDEARSLARRVLSAAGLSRAHVDAVAETMVAGERDGCASHGLYRLLVATDSIAKGVVSVDAAPVLHELAPALVRVDGGGGFAQLAFERGRPLLFEAIQVQGARLPSQRRYAARAVSEREGVALPATLHRDILKLLERKD